MQLLIQYAPRVYLIWLLLCIAGSVVSVIFTDPLTAYAGGTTALSFGFRWISWIVGGLLSVFTAVQLAVLGLHADETVQLLEEKKRLGRLVLCLLYIGWLWCAGEILPYSARNLEVGFSLASEYFWGLLIPATLFIFSGLFFWHLSRERHLI